MKQNAHYNPKSMRWVISLAVMVILSVLVIIGSVVLVNVNDKMNNQPVDLDFTVSKTIPMAKEENELGVTSVAKALDEKGNEVGYVVKTSVVGYNAEVPIETAVTITSDGKYVYGIEIINQEETEYLGVRIAEDGFKNQFSGKRLPIAGSTGIEKGSKVDLIAKSTISSQAVVDAVNGATEYVNTFILA